MESELRFGRYEIMKPLAERKRVIVYLGRDPLLKREVVIKALHPNCENTSETKERFTREALALSQLNHPGICAIYDRSEDFLVIEYIAAYWS